MRLHLFAINNKGGITATNRVFLLWSSLIYMLHVDGIHHTTKKNCLTEIVATVFILMRHDVIRPDRTTSEPSEHSFACMRRYEREFTMNGFISILEKLDRS